MAISVRVLHAGVPCVAVTVCVFLCVAVGVACVIAAALAMRAWHAARHSFVCVVYQGKGCARATVSDSGVYAVLCLQAVVHIQLLLQWSLGLHVLRVSARVGDRE